MTMRCRNCGHVEAKHGLPGDVCYHFDADGPCLCLEFVPCAHEPETLTAHQGKFFKTCVCGSVVVPA